MFGGGAGAAAPPSQEELFHAYARISKPPKRWRIYHHQEEKSLSHLIVFTLGYFLGGVTALVVMGLAVAARRGDSGQSERAHVVRGDESTPA